MYIIIIIKYIIILCCDGPVKATYGMSGITGVLHHHNILANTEEVTLDTLFLTEFFQINGLFQRYALFTEPDSA